MFLYTVFFFNSRNYIFAYCDFKIYFLLKVRLQNVRVPDMYLFKTIFHTLKCMNKKYNRQTNQSTILFLVNCFFIILYFEI